MQNPLEVTSYHFNLRNMSKFRKNTKHELNKFDWLVSTLVIRSAVLQNSNIFPSNGGKAWLLADSVSSFIIIAEQNYLYQSYCLEQTFPRICYNTHFHIWNSEESPPGLKTILTKKVTLESTEYMFRYFLKFRSISETFLWMSRGKGLDTFRWTVHIIIIKYFACLFILNVFRTRCWKTLKHEF